MNKNKLAVAIFLISLGIFSVKADVAPDPGYTSVSVNLILEAPEDFADYRFFLQSPIDVEEVFLKKGETKIDSQGRGGAKRYATLIAVPKNSLAGLSALVTGDDQAFIDLKALHKEIQSKKIAGVIELVKHTFQKHIPINEKSSWTDPVYKLEKDEVKGIRATALKTGGEGVSFGFYEVKRGYTPVAIGLMIGGGFISAAVIFLGIWLFRKNRRKLV